MSVLRSPQVAGERLEWILALREEIKRTVENGGVRPLALVVFEGGCG